ncbi:MAG: right-handed parallel beta-helix repeat-containing protein [Pirellulales bacterium]|nr:right-handed parallel beta-helix repeat-containing protein [Pirellulales bacterium]
MRWLRILFFGAMLCGGSAGTAAETAGTHGMIDARDYGAQGDGTTLDTRAIQAAIDAAAQRGGGEVHLRSGTFLAGTVELRSNVALHLHAGAVLLASTKQADFTHRSLVYAEGAENIAVFGRGVLDGHGALSREFPKVRSHLLHLVNCRNITVKDVTLRNSTTWVQHYFRCTNLLVDGITVDSRINPDIEGPRHLSDAPGRNEDGLNLNSCRQVRVANCRINSDDDGIVLKSTSERPCSNVVISNCVVSSNASAVKLGTESGGGFENINVQNCAIYDTRNAGIALQIVDGGVLDGVNVSNVTMRNVKGSAIFLRLGNRARPYRAEKPGVGHMRNVIISNVQATGVGDWIEAAGKKVVGCSITGLPGHAVENVTLENIRIRFKGGGTLEDAAREVPERPEAYPACRMFGTLPAYGFYCRHVENLRFHNVELRFDNDDHRPAVVCEDVQDLNVFGLDAQSTPSTPAVIWLKQVDGALIHGCRPRQTAGPWLRLDGARSANVSLINNDLSRVGEVVRIGKEVAREAVFQGGRFPVSE